MKLTHMSGWKKFNDSTTIWHLPGEPQVTLSIKKKKNHCTAVPDVDCSLLQKYSRSIQYLRQFSAGILMNMNAIEISESVYESNINQILTASQEETL